MPPADEIDALKFQDIFGASLEGACRIDARKSAHIPPEKDVLKFERTHGEGSAAGLSIESMAATRW